MNPQEAPSIFSLITSQWKWAAGTAVMVLGGGLIYTAVVPAVWEAKTTLIFPTRMPSILGSQGFAEQTSLAATLTGQATPLKVYKGILESERALNYVSKATGIKKRKLMENRDIVDTVMESTITLSYRNRDPKLAQEVVGLHLKALGDINNEVSAPLFFDDVNVLEREMKAQLGKLQKSEAKLLAFQETAQTGPSVTQSGTGRDSTVLSTPGGWAGSLRQLELERMRITTSMNAAKGRTNELAKVKDLPTDLPPVRRWRPKLAEMEYSLRMALQTQPESSPEIQHLKNSIGIAKSQFERDLKTFVKAINVGTLDATSPESSSTTIMQLTVLDAQISAVHKLAQLAPKESVQLSRLMREVSVNSIILQQLQSQYHLARLQKDRNQNRWEVLDEPEISDKPVNKSYTKNGAIAGILGLLLGCLVAGIRGERFYRRSLKPVLMTVEEQEPEALKKAQ